MPWNKQKQKLMCTNAQIVTMKRNITNIILFTLIYTLDFYIFKLMCLSQNSQELLV